MTESQVERRHRKSRGRQLRVPEEATERWALAVLQRLALHLSQVQEYKAAVADRTKEERHLDRLRR